MLSAGIGPNMLLARIATQTAKPNGQALIKPDQARQFLADLEVDQLPGVGWSMRGKLADMGITRVRQVRVLVLMSPCFKTRTLPVATPRRGVISVC